MALDEPKANSPREKQSMSKLVVIAAFIAGFLMGGFAAS
jgi:hypothetical protein